MKVFLAMAVVLLSLFPAAARAQNLPPQQFADLGDLKLESGKSIRNCKLGYRTFGRLNADKSNAILFPMWFTGHSGEAAAYVSPGGLIDEKRYFVIAVDPLGNGVSCSPSNSVTQHGPEFPAYTIRDMVASEYRLLTETLHIPHLHAVIGVSMGGMQTFEWVVDHPAMMDLAVPIVGTPRQSSYDLLLWNAEAAAVRADPGFHDGRYTTRPAMALVSYIHSMNLATPEFRVEHTTPRQFPQFFEQLATEANRANDANDYLSQLQAMIGQNIGRDVSNDAGRDARQTSLNDTDADNGLYRAAAKIKAKMLIVVARQDHMVDPLPALGFAKLMNAPTITLASDCGHLAPGCEMKTLAPQIDSFLASR